jgi:RNA-directed DNA polymerase
MIIPSSLLSFSNQDRIDLMAWDAFGYKNSTGRPRRDKWSLNRARLLLSIQNAKGLSNVLRIDLEQLERIIRDPKYREFKIPKKSRGQRSVQSPSDELKRVQDKLLHLLNCYYLFIRPICVHGFVRRPQDKSRESIGIVSCARPHVGKHTILNIDLKDFFPSITSNNVYALFSSETFDFPENLATGLTMMCTYEGKLPTGAPTSPIISNFICLELDKELMKMSSAFGLTYTRYADDLTFSSDNIISDDIVLDLISLIHSHGFRINERKLRKTGRGTRQSVTGITVNDKLNAPRKLRKLVRAMRHDLIKNGVEIATKRHFDLNTGPSEELQEKFMNKLRGYEQFIIHVKKGLQIGKNYEG